jgi:peptidoglycan/LPS O-acetylase OafA/YrhL
VKIGRAQAMMLLAGLGLAVALAPQWVVPRYGFGAYLVLVAFAVIGLAAVARRSTPRVPRINNRRER